MYMYMYISIHMYVYLYSFLCLHVGSRDFSRVLCGLLTVLWVLWGLMWAPDGFAGFIAFSTVSGGCRVVLGS